MLDTQRTHVYALSRCHHQGPERCHQGPERCDAVQTEAEKAGWEFSKKEGVSLVCINPTFVLGPVVSKRVDATSIMHFKVCP